MQRPVLDTPFLAKLPSQRHSSRLKAGWSTDISIEYYAEACLCCLSHARKGQPLYTASLPLPMPASAAFSVHHGRQYVLVRWTGLNAAGDAWEPLDNLTNREAAIAAFEQATGRSLPRPPPPPPLLAGAACAPTPIRLTGFTVEEAPPDARRWAGPCSTGGPTTAGSAAPSPACVTTGNDRLCKPVSDPTLSRSRPRKRRDCSWQRGPKHSQVEPEGRREMTGGFGREGKHWP